MHSAVWLAWDKALLPILHPKSVPWQFRGKGRYRFFLVASIAMDINSTGAGFPEVTVDGLIRCSSDKGAVSHFKI